MKVSILGLMFLILFTLKVAKVGAVATLSWWWVTAPLWGGFALFIVVVVGLAALSIILGSNGGRRGR